MVLEQTKFTFLVLSRLNGIVHEMRPNVHNKPVLELIPNEYIVHMYDTIDKLMLEVHQQKNGYHPIEHDNVMDEMYPEYQHGNINKNHIPLDELLPHQQLYPEEYYHFYHTRNSYSDREKCSKQEELFVPALFCRHRTDVYDVVFERQ